MTNNLSPSMRRFVEGMCTRAANEWAAGRVERAEHWAAIAWQTVAGHDYIDTDDGAAAPSEGGGHHLGGDR